MDPREHEAFAGIQEQEQKSPRDDGHDLQMLSSTISHEIKAPVRAIDGYARIFLEDYRDKIDEDGLLLISNIRTICGETLAMIDRLLEYTRLSGVEPVKETVNLQQMIQDVCDELAAGYKSKKATVLKFQEEIPFVLCDGTLMHQVVVNLVSNALKFTREEQTAVITAGFHPENGEDVFYIRDNGVGFDMEYSQNLFGMFQRMHSDDEFEGSGVGLSIVKKLIQAMGGRVWITGEVGKGACVYFTLPPGNILK
ncbi:sensor histidine kinase [Caproiciproducens sp. CPB-2]|uniref:sensor histidine kinase n=1 Tax=Caproiciproducens sp. CPB-2 TaxID=3030017 RepID=UPI0023D9D3D5|nr:sensor histidine kinase [Caproiciproducens sp. CPB-2]MDF1493417.1 sensor histidine kinase [Caproiciproducens sp. CPB-2]